MLPLFSAALLGGAGLLTIVLLGFLCVPATVLARRSIPTTSLEVVRPEQAGAILKTLCVRARIAVPVVVFYDDGTVTSPAAWSYSTVWSSIIVLPQRVSACMPADHLRWLLARQCVLIQSGRAFFDALWLYVQLAVLAAVRCFDTLVNGAWRNSSTHPIAWLLAALAVSPVLLVSCVAAMSARAMRRCYPKIDTWLSSTNQTHEMAAITRIVSDTDDGPALAKHA